MEACTFFDTLPASTILQKPATANPVMKIPSFLATACVFQWPTAAMSSTIPMCTPKEEIRDELDCYLRFNAAPISEDENFR